MYFLIHFDLTLKKTVLIKEFKNKPAARRGCLALEMQFIDTWQNHRIFVLEAASREAARRTHGHYFDTP